MVDRLLTSLVALSALCSGAVAQAPSVAREGDKADVEPSDQRAAKLTEITGKKVDKRPGNRNLSGGATVQRKRINTFIENTSSMGLDQALFSLSDGKNEDFNVAHFAGLQSGFGPPIVMKQVLADRRVSKIYELLSQRTTGEASEIVARAFDEKLKKHEDEYSKATRTS